MDKVPTITIAQAVVAITILRDEAYERTIQYEADAAYYTAVCECDAYQTVLNILSNVK